MKTGAYLLRWVGILVLGLLALSQASAQSSEWPNRPIRVITPFAPGGPTDIVLRGAAPRVQQLLGQPLVIDNKPGANGNLGTSEASRAAGDGYTWLWSTDTTMTVNPHVYEKMPFKTSDFQPVIRASTFSQTLVCSPNLGVKTVADLVRKAKRTPLTYASGGAGSPGHLTTEQFLATAGIQITHIPYKGPAPAVQDILGGQVDCGFLAGPTVLPHVRSGRIVALAVSGQKRSALLPDVPTMIEAGYAKFDGTFALVLFAPASVPQATIQKMYNTMATALKNPELVERLTQSDQTVVAESPRDAAARLAQDYQRWGEVAKRINLRLE